jgi:hypothetical protein
VPDWSVERCFVTLSGQHGQQDEREKVRKLSVDASAAEVLSKSCAGKVLLLLVRGGWRVGGCEGMMRIEIWMGEGDED